MQPRHNNQRDYHGSSDLISEAGSRTCWLRAPTMRARIRFRANGLAAIRTVVKCHMQLQLRTAYDPRKLRREHSARHPPGRVQRSSQY